LATETEDLLDSAQGVLRENQKDFRSQTGIFHSEIEITKKKMCFCKEFTRPPVLSKIRAHFLINVLHDLLRAVHSFWTDIFVDIREIAMIPSDS
jgi:hypothetical protein